jgi:hypothetical protein
MQAWDWIKKSAKAVARSLPGVAKVTSMAGGTAFSVEKFFAWRYNTPNGLSSIPGASYTSVGTAMTTVVGIVVRFFNMTRQKHTQAILADQLPINSPIPPTIIQANWSHPEGDDQSWHVGYKAMQLMAVSYLALTTATSGYLSAFSLAKLATMIPGAEFNSTCEEEHSATAKIVIVHLAALFLAYASIRSFNKANLVMVREYHRDLFTDGNWRNVSAATMLVTSIGVATSIVGNFFSNKHTFMLLQENTLCHLSRSIEISETIQIPLALLSCLSNISINGLMTLAAVHKRHTLNIQPIKLSDELEKNPEFKRFNLLILICLFGNSVNSLLSTIVSFAKLPASINSDNADLSYHPAMITSAIVLGLFAMKNQYALDYEGYIKELHARTLIRQTIDSLSLNAPLLNDNDSANLEQSVNELDQGIRRHPSSNSLSIPQPFSLGKPNRISLFGHASMPNNPLIEDSEQQLVISQSVP